MEYGVGKDSAHGIADHAGKQNAGGKERGLAQIESVILDEIIGNSV